MVVLRSASGSSLNHCCTAEGAHGEVACLSPALVAAQSRAGSQEKGVPLKVRATGIAHEAPIATGRAGDDANMSSRPSCLSESSNDLLLDCPLRVLWSGLAWAPSSATRW
eukprot:1286454-Alexandrium_andersonii.AAC.1